MAELLVVTVNVVLLGTGTFVEIERWPARAPKPNILSANRLVRNMHARRLYRTTDYGA
jgi:hypothetical protein